MPTASLQELYQQFKEQDQITILPAGPYKLTVIRATTRNGGKGPVITPIYKVAEGPYAGKTVMAGPMTLSEASRSIFFRQMAGFGLDESFFATVGTMDDVANALVGRTVEAQLVIEPWQGEDRNKLQIGGLRLVSASGPVVPGAPAPPAAAQPAAAAPPPPPPPPAQAAPPPAAPIAPQAQVPAEAVEQPQPVPAEVPVEPQGAPPPPPPPPPPPAPSGAAPRSF